MDACSGTLFEGQDESSARLPPRLTLVLPGVAPQSFQRGNYDDAARLIATMQANTIPLGYQKSKGPNHPRFVRIFANHYLRE